MRTKRQAAKDVEDKTEENPMYVGRRACGVLNQRRDERPPSPQPGPSGFRGAAGGRPANWAKRKRNPCVATIELEIMNNQEVYDEINESEMINDFDLAKIKRQENEDDESL